MSYTEQEILDELDRCAKNLTFPMLDNGYIYPIDVRLHAYRDDQRWLVIIEVFGFDAKAGGHDGVSTCLHSLGNCLCSSDDVQFLYMVDDGSGPPLFEEDFGISINPQAEDILIRGRSVFINLDHTRFLEKGIELQESPRILAFELFRLLDVIHRDNFLATASELKELIPNGLDHILTLDEWHHPDLSNGEQPSQNETFKMIARAMVNNDASIYTPAHEPNTHWKNWPNGGTL